jgi:hypothetical protein
MSDHWLGGRVVIVHQTDSHFDKKLISEIYGNDERSLLIAQVKLRCDEMFTSALDGDLTITHLSPFDDPPIDSSQFATRLPRSRRAFLRAVLQDGRR